MARYGCYFNSHISGVRHEPKAKKPKIIKPKHIHQKPNLFIIHSTRSGPSLASTSLICISNHSKTYREFFRITSSLSPSFKPLSNTKPFPLNKVDMELQTMLVKQGVNPFPSFGSQLYKAYPVTDK
ncbi:MAG: hypothetical protein QXV01_03935 [Candidatus Bathyarchaeia archaeon]